MYKKVVFSTGDDATREIVIAMLSEVGYEGFEEGESELVGFIPLEAYDQALIDELARQFNISVNTENIAQQNWNAVWEAGFAPVVIEDYCTIRAHFHQVETATQYEIVITPKMSFGTGHHATTQLMVSMMKTLPLSGKKVLDFGTGTGVLAILAAKIGASEVVAIDNDSWCFENATENIERNDVSNVSVRLGTLEVIGDERFDIVLANINRHILLETMQRLADLLEGNGKIVLSGLLKEDREVILESAAQARLKIEAERELNNWIALLLGKM